MNRSSSFIGRKGFTLIELLIVLAIIGLLTALLFPAFKRAQEGGAQASCMANLKQIYQAVQLYKQDEKYYPSSLAHLLPNDFSIGNHGGATTHIPMSPPAATAGPACDTAAFTCPNPDGTGYFKGGRDGLVCSDDDYSSTTPRSSYGDISTNIGVGVTDDMGRYVWNYWGYKDDGTAYLTSTDAAAAATSLLVTTTGTYNARTNPIKYSLSNRYAPTSTIITHCVYHRLPTASGKIAAPGEIYTDPTNGALARDIILRLDGSTKPLDVSQFKTNGNWQSQNKF